MPPPVSLEPYACVKTVTLKDTTPATVIATLQALLAEGLPPAASVNLGPGTLTASWSQTA